MLSFGAPGRGGQYPPISFSLLLIQSLSSPNCSIPKVEESGDILYLVRTYVFFEMYNTFTARE